MSVAVPFPQVRPDGYEWLGDEPAFDPTLHLDIRPPTSVTMLTDLRLPFRHRSAFCPTTERRSYWTRPADYVRSGPTPEIASRTWSVVAATDRGGFGTSASRQKSPR